MSTRPDEQASQPLFRDASASEIEAVAERLIALVEEFEATISEGHLPPVFAERLAQLRQSAGRLIDP